MTAITTNHPAVVRHAPSPSRARVIVAAGRAEWTKMRSVRSTMWTLLTTVGLAIGFGALVAVSQMNSWDTLSATERLRFDPTSFSLSGLFLAQMAVGVLGVLMITSEYATGQIRATLAATPQRSVVLAAKVGAFVVVVLTVGLLASFGAFGIGQAIFATKDLGVSLHDPGVLRAVTGGGLYLAAVGALGIGLGTVLRRTAGAVAALVGLLLVIPLVTSFLPSSWSEQVAKYFPAQAGTAIFRVAPDATSLSPWVGFAVLVAYAAVALALGALLLARRDA
jgi:ABC-type transport system involved in multi-copper enzyme maturation permease subunit